MVALQGRPPPARGDRVKHAFTSRSVRAGGVSLRGHVTIQPPAGIRGFFHQLGPVLMTAVTFSTADICGKVALTSGTDVTSILSFRSVIGLGLVFAW